MKHTVTMTGDSTPRSESSPFRAVGIIISNPTGYPLYVRVGGTDAPDASSATFVVPPATYIAQPVQPTTLFAFRIGDKTFQSEIGSVITIEITDQKTAPAYVNFNLPQIAFAPRYINLPNNNIAAGANLTLYTVPAPYTNLYIFGCWASVDHPTGTIVDCRIQFFQGIFQDLVRIKAAVPAAPIYYTMPPLVLPTQGLPLMNVSSIRVLNAAATAGNFNIALTVLPF